MSQVSCVLWSCLWFCHSLLALDGHSLLFLNKPIFAGKITGSFIFKVDSYMPPDLATVAPVDSGSVEKCTVELHT